MAADGFQRKFHRILAIAFLVTVPLATFASFRGGEPAFLVYLPLFPLLGLTLTGIYLLARPWIARRRAL